MSLSRRELLTLLLGSTLGMKACRRPMPNRVPGKVVGGAIDRGHRLLSPPSPVPQAVSRRVEIAIVGAGLSGLSSAWRLERRGEPRFAVFELEDRAGGTSAYGTDAIVPYPWAAHYLPLPRADAGTLVSLLEEMKLVERYGSDRLKPREGVLVRYPDERLFVENRWIEGLVPRPLLGAEGAREMARFEAIVNRWVAFRDARGRRAFGLPVASCSDDPEVTVLDEISAAQWLKREGFRSRPFRWLLEYGCRDDYGCSLETTSAWAFLFYHAARVPAPGHPSAPFLTWPEGNGHFVRYLEGVVGSRLELGRMVVDIVPGAEAVDLTVWDAKHNRSERVVARHVVVATPTFLRERLLRPYREQRPSFLDAFSYSPWMVANLHLRGRPRDRGLPFAWDNVIYGGASLGYVVATHQTLRDDGPTVWTYYQPFVDNNPAIARHRLAAAHHGGACDAILSELAAAHPGLDRWVERIDVWRWGHAMVRPVPNMAFGEARHRAMVPLGRVHFANADLSAMPLLEEAHFHGVRAADEVLSDQERDARTARGSTDAVGTDILRRP